MTAPIFQNFTLKYYPNVGQDKQGIPINLPNKMLKPIYVGVYLSKGSPSQQSPREFALEGGVG